MSIRVLVNGANGRMGQAAVKALQNEVTTEWVGSANRADDLATLIRETQAQVVVDFTNADAVKQSLKTIIAAGAHPVVGTSGLLGEQIKVFQTQCEGLQLGGIIAPNFSLGAVLMMKHAQEIAKYFGHVEIIEMHHDGKLDSPSGTSLRTAEMLSVNFKSEAQQKKTRENIPGSRGASHHGIPIHAVRMPGFVASEQIIFGAKGETLTLRHDSIDRECFMPGVILACQKVVELRELVYGLEHVL